MELAPHFTLAEMCRTEVRRRNDPPPAVVESLRDLCQEILEPLRFAMVPRLRITVGPIHVNSGFRSESVNKAVGGAKNSAHIEGRAADIIPIEPGVTCVDLMEAILASNLPFDKAIFESPASSTWIHVQIAKGRSPPRKQALMSLAPNAFSLWDPRRVA